MYLYEVMKRSTELNGLTRVRMKSGDVLEGKFVEPIGDAMLEFDLKAGGRAYLVMNMIESITLLDNLQMLEQKANEQPSL
jgi:hypothetical protein